MLEQDFKKINKYQVKCTKIKIVQTSSAQILPPAVAKLPWSIKVQQVVAQVPCNEEELRGEKHV